MPQADPTLRGDASVKERLVQAAEAELAARGIGAVTMEAVARRAGVSRATAFRQLGTTYELLVQVALSHARQHTVAMQAVMDEAAGVFDKLEAALSYSTRKLTIDPMISALIAQHSTSAHPLVLGVAVDLVAPVLLEGQRAGVIRTDIAIDELVQFIVEQSYLAAEREDRSDDEVRRRFRHFVVPALAKAATAPTADDPSPNRSPEVQHAVREALNAVEQLAVTLRKNHG